MPSQRYKLTIAYRGTRYHGWQSQGVPNTWKGDPLVPTIQYHVTRALSEILGHPLRICGSSRTDAGVHAKGQIAHFDTEQDQIPPENLRRAANHRLPEDIVLREILPVPPEFDAINSVRGKRYQYAIWNQPDRTPFAFDLYWHRWQTLDVPAMQAAAARLEGRHDFASFARPGHGRDSTVRTVSRCRVSRRGPLLIIGVEGEGFLWNMVRIMVGTLVEVGLGRWNAEDMDKTLAVRDRRAAGPTAPPQGLYLQWIRIADQAALLSKSSWPSPS